MYKIIYKVFILFALFVFFIYSDLVCFYSSYILFYLFIYLFIFVVLRLIGRINFTDPYIIYYNIK